MSVENQPTASPSAQYFPFVAVVGQPLLKRALLLALLAPQLGGVLIQGPRGVAKSTLARGLTDFLDDSCKRFVELPLGASSDRVTGSIDLQHALAQQQHAFQPGLLAAADGGILYIDEVNLLDDSLVDVLLDVAASGINRVERDGISHTHSARFLLIGTMNPDEGELRPQLGDRFGLGVQLDGTLSQQQRIDIVRARLAYDADPAAFSEAYQKETVALAGRLNEARRLLPRVTLSEACEVMIAERAAAYQLEGVRADIAWRRAALANAALEGRSSVTENDIALVEPLVVNHRHDPHTPPPAPDNGGHSGNGGNDDGTGGGSRGGTGPSNTSETSPGKPRSSLMNNASTSSGAHQATASESTGNEALQAAMRALKPDSPDQQHSRQRATTKRPTRISREGLVRTQRQHDANDPIDGYQSLIHTGLNKAGNITLVRRSRKAPVPTQQLIMLDLSGSTLGGNAIDRAASLVMALADTARRHRSAFALLGFGQQGATWICRGRRPPARLYALIRQLKAGGGTPLQDALDKGRRFLAQRSHQQPGLACTSYLITDGRSTRLPDHHPWPGRLTVMDCESGRLHLGRAQRVAERLQGIHWSLASAIKQLEQHGNADFLDPGPLATNAVHAPFKPGMPLTLASFSQGNPYS